MAYQHKINGHNHLGLSKIVGRALYAKLEQLGDVVAVGGSPAGGCRRRTSSCWRPARRAGRRRARHDHRGDAQGYPDELVGEIEDEFGTCASEEFTYDGSAILIEGGASIRMLEQKLRVKVSKPLEATVGGHLVELLGRVPEVSEILELDGYNVEVRGVDEARITRLRFEPGPL